MSGIGARSNSQILNLISGLLRTGSRISGPSKLEFRLMVDKVKNCFMKTPDLRQDQSETKDGFFAGNKKKLCIYYT